MQSGNRYTVLPKKVTKQTDINPYYTLVENPIITAFTYHYYDDAATAA